MQNSPMRPSNYLTGIFLLIIANVCFSAKAVIIKLLYREGVDVQTVLGLRMLLALPFYAGMAFYLGRRSGNVRLTAREWLSVSALATKKKHMGKKQTKVAMPIGNPDSGKPG